MERHKIPWFRTTNQSLNSHFEWIYPTYHQTSKQLMTFSEGQNGVVPPPFSCISHRRPAITKVHLHCDTWRLSESPDISTTLNNIRHLTGEIKL